MEEVGLSMLPTDMIRHGVSMDTILADGVSVVALVAMAGPMIAAKVAAKGAQIAVKAFMAADVAITVE